MHRIIKELPKELRNLERRNYKRARKWFEGKGLIPDDGNTYVLHHKDDTLVYNNVDRYIEWNIDDLEVMEVHEHNRMHKLGKTPWNKGLTKEDHDGIRRQGEKVAKKQLGGHLTEEWKKHISEARKNKYPHLPKKKCPYCDAMYDAGNLAKHIKKKHNDTLKEEN